MAVTSLFVENQLEHVRNEVVNQDFPERLIASGRLLPIDTSVPAWAETYSYRLMTKLGAAKILANGAEDIEEVAAFVEKRQGNIRTIANQFSYSYQDMENANFAGVNIGSELGMAAREIMEADVDALGYSGDANHGLLGFLTHPNIPTYTLLADGTGSTTTWSTKTADKIYRDLRAFAAQMRSTTNRVETPDIILMPGEQFDLIAETEYPAGTGKTLLSFFLDNQRLVPGGVRQIIPVPYLKGQGTGGTDLMIAFRQRPDKIRFHIPLGFTMRPTQEIGMTYRTVCIMRCGGIEIRKPTSLVKTEGL